jgi:hypothetical protein
VVPSAVEGIETSRISLGHVAEALVPAGALGVAGRAAGSAALELRHAMLTSTIPVKAGKVIRSCLVIINRFHDVLTYGTVGNRIWPAGVFSQRAATLIVLGVLLYSLLGRGM